MADLQISLDFIRQLKQQILDSRYRVAKIANAESLGLYFLIGKALDKKFEEQKWGARVLDIISERLQQELPGLRGFSGSNLRKMRIFYKAWGNNEIICSSITNKLGDTVNVILPSLTDKLDTENINAFFSISFTHHYEIITQIKESNNQWYYINKAASDFWSVRHLKTELKNQSHLQWKILPNNFENTIGSKLSNKAIRSFKDQYLLDFVNVEDADDEIDERILEKEIVLNIKKFLMSLGNEFAFMGNQYRLIVEEREYYIDLLFFNRKLQALVAFDLKKGKFKPEYLGKMNFYLSALDDLIKQPHENPSIGIILCKEKNNKIVEYSFRDFNKAMGVATYKTSKEIPEQFKNILPDAETLKKLME
ncbi:MAG: hypothetical protein B6D61_02070 [Bacteroidetes bacterium 4484_249]|nr:MAG: hypothetical protein B6D61_02070 [Bacteroidetes bacterium 4484_249]